MSQRKQPKQRVVSSHGFKRVNIEKPGVRFFELENLEREAVEYHRKWMSDPVYAKGKVEYINEVEIRHAKKDIADKTISIYQDGTFHVEFKRYSGMIFATVYLHDGTVIYRFSRSVPSVTATLNEISSIELSHDVPKTIDDVKKRKPAELRSIVDAFEASDNKLGGHPGYYCG